MARLGRHALGEPPRIPGISNLPGFPLVQPKGAVRASTMRSGAPGRPRRPSRLAGTAVEDDAPRGRGGGPAAGGRRLRRRSARADAATDDAVLVGLALVVTGEGDARQGARP